MSRSRPTVISLVDLEQAATNASVLALDERQLVDVSGGALIEPVTTLGMMPPRPLDPTIVPSPKLVL